MAKDEEKGYWVVVAIYDNGNAALALSMFSDPKSCEEYIREQSRLDEITGMIPRRRFSYNFVKLSGDIHE